MSSKPLTGKSVLMIIARQAFRDEELEVPRGILKNAGATITIASRSIQESVGMLGQVRLKPDLTLQKVDPTAYDAVVFIGGSGASEYFDYLPAHNIAVKAYEAGKVVAAICIAPATLANAGVLKGKKAACLSTVKDTLMRGGARLSTAGVERDGRVITANGPQNARAFAEAIRDALAGK